MISSRKVIIFDIDGVACNHALSICNQVNRDYSLNSKPEDVISWNHDFGRITFVDAVEKYYPEAAFILSMNVTDGFNEIVKILAKKATIRFATSRAHSQEATKKWVTKKIGEYDVCFVSEKHGLQGDILVDDHEGTVVKFASTGRTSLLFNQPWNENDGVNERLARESNARRISTFKEILNFI